MSDAIRMNPDTGLPYEEIALYLAVSDQVLEHLDRDQTLGAFGQYLIDGMDDRVTYWVADESDGDHVLVRVAARDDGGFSMTLADEEPSS